MSTSIFGSVVHRVEDPRFLTGASRYVDDLVGEAALRAVFVRSIMAHARVLGVDVSGATAMPGVVAVLLPNDLGLSPQAPGAEVEGPFARPVLAEDVVRFVGEPVALVLADTLGRAMDAAETVVVDLDPLETTTDPERAAATEAPLLFPDAGTNVAASFEDGWDEDVLAEAEVVVRLTVRHRRVAPVPMEPDAILVVPGDGSSLTVWVSTQVPFDVRAELAERLGTSPETVRVVAPDVGGGFGAKVQIYPELVACAVAAVRLGRPVAWQETRSESMVGLTHGRAQIHEVELGASRDGRLTGLRVDILADMGAYPIATEIPPTTRSMLPGVYAIPRVASRGRSVVTNTTPVGPYRGAGRPEAALSIERAIEALAARLGVDPAELRRRNLIPLGAFPFTTAVGSVYDVGDYRRALDEALRIVGYDDVRREQAERRARGDPMALGIGLSVYVEVTGAVRKEYGSVEIAPEGGAVVRVGTSSNGQGHETAFAQVVSGVLGVPVDRVRVLHSDTAEVPRGEGTFGSRSLQIAGSSVYQAAEEVLDRAKAVAAGLLEVAPEDLEPVDAGIGVTGAPERSIAWPDLFAAASSPKGPDTRNGLRAEVRRFQKGHTYPFGAHAAVVEIDLETGDVALGTHVAVDDCGRVLNPLLVEGQVHGGLGQGIAQALFEEVIYDELGSPLTANLTTYLMPAASELPSFVTARIETPTPLNPLGAKGIGESAAVGSTPAIVNAAVDALAHLGVRHLDPPLSPERVWRAIRDAGGA